jgi:hypothetical protein
MLLVRILLVAVSMLSAMVLPKNEEFVVIKGNKITVAAGTSLGNINCAYTSSSRKDTLLLNRLIPQRERLILALPVKDFDCGNLLLDKDFANTLNVKEYPYIRIELVRLDKQNKDYKGTLQLEVAGKTMVLDNVQFQTCAGKTTDLLKSNLCLNFSEIGLATPKKLGGLFKVEDELRINVELQVNKQQPKVFTEPFATYKSH